MRQEIKRLMHMGFVDQHELFQMLYPRFNGHYGRLRDMISEVKNDGVR